MLVQMENNLVVFMHFTTSFIMFVAVGGWVGGGDRLPLLPYYFG